MGGVQTRRGQQGRRGGGWGDDRGFRDRSEEQSLQGLESDVLGNLLSASGEIGGNTETAGWGTRTLGVPTVADRIAQTVVALELEVRTEEIFHDDSYGYRPRRSALDAVETCRRRCQKRNWVLDLDVAQFFDSVDHDLMVKAVQANTDKPWVVLYV